MTDWITFPVVFTTLIVLAIIALVAVLVLRQTKRNHVAPPPSTRGAAKNEDGKGPTSSKSESGGGWKRFWSSFKGGFGILTSIAGVAAVLLALFLGYLLVSTVWGEITNPAGIYESSSRPERDTASRPSFGEKCPKLSRGEHHTCGMKTAMAWTFFETGPQVEGYQVSILPDYDLDRQRPEAERAYRELHFLLDDGTSFRYEGKPPPRMAVAFRAVVNRPTEFIYKMDPAR